MFLLVPNGFSQNVPDDIAPVEVKEPHFLTLFTIYVELKSKSHELWTLEEESSANFSLYLC